MVVLSISDMLRFAPHEKKKFDEILTAEELSWTAGVFDAGSSVQANFSQGGICVAVSKVPERIETLERLYGNFGGCISNQGKMKTWQVKTNVARDVCESITNFSMIKKSTFEVAASFPSDQINLLSSKPLKAVHKETGQTEIFGSCQDAKRRIGALSLSKCCDNPERSALNRLWTSLENPIKKEDVVNRSDEIKDALRNLVQKDTEVDVTRFNDAYFAGLFESIGKVVVDSSGCTVWITHWSDNLCRALQEKLGGVVKKVEGKAGSACKSTWTKSGQNDVMIRAMLPYMSAVARAELEKHVGREVIEKPVVTPSMLYAGVKKNLTIPWDTISEDQRWWVAGVVEGDGCVRVCPVNGLMVRVSQAENGWHCLVYLKEVFGGAVYDCTPEQGNFQAMAEWCIRGINAWDFCMVIKDYCFIKRNQLEAGCEFCFGEAWMAQMKPVLSIEKRTGVVKLYPSIAQAQEETGTHRTSINMYLKRLLKSTTMYTWMALENVLDLARVRERRKELEERLMAMKQTEHEEVQGDLPLPYMAGFVDADGHIGVHGDSHAHSVSQKYIAICRAFQRRYGGGICRSKTTGCYNWYTHVGTAKQFIMDIEPYLIEKKEQARLVIEMGPGEGKGVAAALSKINGKQRLKANRAIAKELELSKMEV